MRRIVCEQVIKHGRNDETMMTEGFFLGEFFFDGKDLYATRLRDIECLPPKLRHFHKIRRTNRSIHILDTNDWVKLPKNPKQHHLFIDHHGYTGRGSSSSHVSFSLHLMCGWETVWRQSFTLTAGMCLLLSEGVADHAYSKERVTNIQILSVL